MGTFLSFAVKSIVPKLLGGVGIGLTALSVCSIIYNRIYDEEKIANQFKKVFLLLFFFYCFFCLLFFYLKFNNKSFFHYFNRKLTI